MLFPILQSSSLASPLLRRSDALPGRLHPLLFRRNILPQTKSTSTGLRLEPPFSGFLHMDLCSWCSLTLIHSLLIALFLTTRGVSASTFTFVNNCDYTVWPGVLANAGSPQLSSTGFELPKDTSRSFLAPTGWSGRFWGRTGCNFGGSGSGSGSCLTGDCGSGQLECNGAGAAPPATLAEFTLGTGGGLDFYDVSLVDGFNVPMIVEGTGGTGTCASTGCSTDLNLRCPSELRVGEGDACKSACEAFGSPEYCCSGAYGSPSTCRPSVYSEMFKSACPKSYSYAYDDASSTFTCSGADYTITFCPSSPSQKSSSISTPMTASVLQGSTFGSSGTESEPGLGYSGSGSEEAVLADGSWLAGLAMGDAQRNTLSPTLKTGSTVLSAIFVFSLYL